MALRYSALVLIYVWSG